MILVVDPDRDMQTILSLFLGEAGHEVVTAGDGAAALALVGRLGPAVIVGEHPLPLPDGRTLCQALSAEPSTADIPFVVVTARVLPEELEEAGRLHGAVFTKPPIFTELVRTVDGLARARRSRTRAAATSR